MRFCLTALVLAALLAPARGAPDDDFKREGDGEKRKAKDALENKTPPTLQVKDWMNTDGKNLTLADLKGKVVVLDFWGVWCPPCIKAIPKLKELYAQHHKDGLVIIGVHTVRDGEKMADFVKKEGLPYPVAIDVDGMTVKSFLVDSYPDYYLIDRAGKLRVADLANADLERALGVLLKEKAPK
jgi:thiol-disulfide isomerase/thioredoxin